MASVFNEGPFLSDAQILAIYGESTEYDPYALADDPGFRRRTCGTFSMWNCFSDGKPYLYSRACASYDCPDCSRRKLRAYRYQVKEISSDIFRDEARIFYWPVVASGSWIERVKKHRQRLHKSGGSEWLYVPTGEVHHYFTSVPLYSKAPVTSWCLPVAQARDRLVDLLQPGLVTHKPSTRRGGPWRFIDQKTKAGGFALGQSLRDNAGHSLDDEVWDVMGDRTECEYGFRYESDSAPPAKYQGQEWRDMWKLIYAKARAEVASAHDVIETAPVKDAKPFDPYALYQRAG